MMGPRQVDQAPLLQSVLRWQEAISAMGHNYVSPLISSFSCQGEYAALRA
jgi:hypothetical protein